MATFAVGGLGGHYSTSSLGCSVRFFFSARLSPGFLLRHVLFGMNMSMPRDVFVSTNQTKHLHSAKRAKTLPACATGRCETLPIFATSPGLAAVPGRFEFASCESCKPISEASWRGISQACSLTMYHRLGWISQDRRIAADKLRVCICDGTGVQ